MGSVLLAVQGSRRTSLCGTADQRGVVVFSVGCRQTHRGQHSVGASPFTCPQLLPREAWSLTHVPSEVNRTPKVTPWPVAELGPHLGLILLPFHTQELGSVSSLLPHMDAGSSLTSSGAGVGRVPTLQIGRLRLRKGAASPHCLPHHGPTPQPIGTRCLSSFYRQRHCWRGPGGVAPPL